MRAAVTKSKARAALMLSCGDDAMEGLLILLVDGKDCDIDRVCKATYVHE